MCLSLPAITPTCFLPNPLKWIQLARDLRGRNAALLRFYFAEIIGPCLISGENGGSEDNCPESSSLSSALCKRSSFIALRRAIYSSTIQVDILHMLNMSHASVLRSGAWTWVLFCLMNLFSFSDNDRIQGCHPNANGGDKLPQLFALSFSGLPFGRTY